MYQNLKKDILLYKQFKIFLHTLSTKCFERSMHIPRCKILWMVRVVEVELSWCKSEQQKDSAQTHRTQKSNRKRAHYRNRNCWEISPKLKRKAIPRKLSKEICGVGLYSGLASLHISRNLQLPHQISSKGLIIYMYMYMHHYSLPFAYGS